ncbi:MAG: glycosyltransferase family 2 protein [Streptosporangiaceae bacterium]
MSDLPAAPDGAGACQPLSVVMPIRDEERHLAEAVRCVLDQDYPARLELILAVGPSRDRTARIAAELAAADPRITVVPNPSGRIPSAINLAIKASRHPLIARVDGHALLPPGYLRTAAVTLAQTGAVNVGGIMAAAGVTPFEQAVAWAMTSPFGVGGARFHTGGQAGPADTAYMGFFRREAVEQVGGYNEDFLVAEDWEMNHRIRQSGGLIWFQPAMRVTYRPRSTVGALGLQYFRYGRWRRVVSRQHPGTINLRYTAPPAVVAALAAGTLAGVAGLAGLAAGADGWWPAVATAGFAAPVLYGAGLLAVTGTAARALRPAALARLPLVLATMHVSWGTGFLTSSRSLVPGSSPRRPWRPGRGQPAGSAPAGSAPAGSASAGPAPGGPGGS